MKNKDEDIEEMLLSQASLDDLIKMKIEAEFKELDKLNLNRKFTIDILSKKFDFYMYKEQKTKALEVLDKIKELKEEKLYKHLYSIYDITFNKQFENIDDLLKLYEKEEDIYQKAIYEMVISEMYLKDGNEEKSKEYLARYQEHIKEEEKQSIDQDRLFLKVVVFDGQKTVKRYQKA